MIKYLSQIGCYSITNVILVGYVSVLVHAGDTGPAHLVCQWEKFNATCPSATEVVVIDGALYGRMERSRCMQDTGYRQDGCSADVHTYMDHLCSGRRRCQIEVPDRNLDSSPHRCGDLKAYLEVSYHCLEVNQPENVQCRSSQAVLLPRGPGYIPSILTSETQVGSSRCPWLIEVESVQTITIYLIDFGVWKGAGSAQGRQETSVVCEKYAVIKDGVSDGVVPVCGGLEARETKIFTSTSNRVYITIMTEDDAPAQFLLKYEANGCTGYIPGEGMKVSRVSDTMVKVGCKGGEGFEVDVQCMGSMWTPLGGILPNCSSSAASGGWWGLGASSLSHQGLLIVILVSVALLVIIIVLTIGICCLCHFKAREQASSLTNESFDPITGRYAMTSHPGDMKELYPMLSKSDREPVDWERDYATTLQMRQMAHPSMHAMNPDPHFFPQFHHHQSPSTNCCYCPVHGPACSENNTRGRTSSFRPHSEHIYEVPRFESDVFEETEHGGGPTVYHELNNQNQSGFRGEGNMSLVPHRSHNVSYNAAPLNTSRNASLNASRNILDDQQAGNSLPPSSGAPVGGIVDSELARASSIPRYRAETAIVPQVDELKSKT